MLLSNLAPERGLVNGSRGVVIGFAAPEAEIPKELQEWFQKNGSLVPVVRFASGPLSVLPRESTCESGDDLACRIQLPLALCFAITVHKSQGLTLDKVSFFPLPSRLFLVFSLSIGCGGSWRGV